MRKTSPQRSVKPKTSRPGKARPNVLTAKGADKHVLYQQSVQNPELEVEFVTRTFRRLRKREARALREDFCGTAHFSATWVRTARPRTATGVDLDRSVLAWARRHNIDPLPAEAQARVSLLQQDVRAPSRRQFDVIVAFNFSYWVFRTRHEMGEYFRHARQALVDDGVFFLDAYGGWEAHQPMEERRSIKAGFTYVWDQHDVCPISNSITNHIHFEFPDGSRLRRAFTYEWRLWSLAELRELLAEAGFSRVAIYWDCSKVEGEEDYRPTTTAPNQPGWIAYILAMP